MLIESRGLFYIPDWLEIPHARINAKGIKYIPVTPEVLPYIMKIPVNESARNAITGLQRDLLYLNQQRESLEKLKPVDLLSFRYMPMAHQIDSICRMIHTKYACLWADCGLGKTYTIINLVEEMKSQGIFKGCLVVCPVSLIKAVWIEEIVKYSNMSYFNLRMKKTIKGKTSYTIPPQGMDFYLINYEQLNKRKRQLTKLGCNVIVFDESTKVKNSGTTTWKAADEIVDAYEYRYLLSGSPMPHGPEDAWAQIYLLDRGMTLGTTHWYFMARTHHKIELGTTEKVMWKPTAEGIEWTKRQLMKISLRYDKHDCLDLPPGKDILLKCELTSKQRKAYEELKEEYCTIIDGEYVIARNTMALLPKFQQITGGFAKNTDGQIITFKDNPKLDLLEETVLSISDKVIIWAWFRHEVKAIYKRLTETGLSCVYVYGQMNENVVHENIQAFKTGTQVLIANQAVLGYGHNLVCAHYAITYSNPINYIFRHQSRERIDRKGQTEHMFFYDLVAKDSVDEKVLRGLSSHESMMRYLLKVVV